MRILILLVMLGMMSGNQILISGQYTPLSPSMLREVEPLKKRPELGVDYAGAAHLKLISRKNAYHRGEMMNLDLALLNIGDGPLFFRKLDDVKFYVSYKNKKEELILPYFLFMRVLSIDSYSLLQPTRMLNESFQLLSTCDERAFNQLTDTKNDNDKDDKRAFEDGRFINWGQACFDFKEPGAYTIVAEQVNQFVVSSSHNKTAVGKIRSTPLTITITE